MTLFEYIPGSSKIHLLDARIKFFSLWASSVLIMNSTLPFSVLFTIAAYIGARILRLKPGRVLLRILPIFIFLSAIVISQIIQIMLFAETGIVKMILINNSQYILQISTLILTGYIFIATTSMAELRRALLWLTRPLPVKAQNVLCLGAFLTIRFIPVLSDEVSIRSSALKLRGLIPKKHPIKYVSLLIKNLLISAFKRSYSISDALIVRGFKIDTRVKSSMTFSVGFITKTVAIAVFTYGFLVFMTCELLQIM